jgi:SOS-response transcriptional repressor LexA
MEILNKKQEIFLAALKAFNARNGRMPSVRELKEEVNAQGLSLSSSRSIALGLKELEDLGYIKRTSERYGIEIIERQTEFFLNIPIFGMANCGSPCMVAENRPEGMLKVSKNRFGSKLENKKIFAIQAAGNSLNLAKVGGNVIENYDYLLIDPNYQTFKGDGSEVVLAIIDGLATVKVLKYTSDGNVVLSPKSSEKFHEQIHLTRDDDFVINGLVVEVMKS